MNDSNNIIDKLKDIKASTVIQIDFTPYILSIITIVLILIVFTILFLYLKNKKRIRLTKKQIAQNNLRNLDFNKDTKQIVYSFSINGYESLDDKNKDEFEQIIRKLEPYKYKKVVTNISSDLVSDMKEYIKVRV